MLIPALFNIESNEDREYLEQLYLKYRRLMVSQITGIIGLQADVEDVLHIVVEKLIPKIAFLRSLNAKKEINYIISCCKNAAFNYIRDNKNKKVFSLDEDVDFTAEIETVPSSEELVIIHAEKIDIRTAFERLSPRNKTILKMKYLLRYSNEEIAAELHIRPQSVRMALSRARQELKAILISMKF